MFIRVWNVRWKLPSNFAKQIWIRLQFAFRLACSICDGTEDWRAHRRRFKSINQSINKSIKRHLGLSQTLQSSRRSPGVLAPPTPPFNPQRRWASVGGEHNQKHYPITVDFRRNKSSCSPAVPLTWTGARLQQGPVLWRYGNVREGNQVQPILNELVFAMDVF